MADVVFGFVQDFGPDEEWVALARRGAHARRLPLDPASASAARADGKLECSGSSPPTRAGSCSRPTRWRETAHRLRAIGAIAVSLCQVAAGAVRRDGDAEGCRAVDAAAAQLIVREAGGSCLHAYDDPLAAPLDLEPHSPVVAARTPRGSPRCAVPAWPIPDACHPGRGDRLELAGTVARGVANLQPAGDPAPFSSSLSPPRRPSGWSPPTPAWWRPSPCRSPRRSSAGLDRRQPARRCAACSNPVGRAHRRQAGPLGDRWRGGAARHRGGRDLGLPRRARARPVRVPGLDPTRPRGCCSSRPTSPTRPKRSRPTPTSCCAGSRCTR